MIAVTNDAKTNIQELLKTDDVDLLLSQFFSVLAREKLNLYAQSFPYGESHVITVVIETKDHHVGKKGLYRLLSADTRVEYTVGNGTSGGTQ